jgi:hypothetical protein
MRHRYAKPARARSVHREHAAAQASPVPDDVSERYAGQWVAIRGREVIASADDLDALKAKAPSIGDDAMPLFVPNASDPF